MKKYLQDLETELRKNNLREEEIQDILDDHREMIETAIAEGLTDEDLESKFGNPKDVAEELSQFSEKKNEGREKKTKMKTKEFTGIEKGYQVTINVVNDDIEVVHANDDKITIEYTGKRDLEDYKIEYQNNEFLLEEPKGGLFKRSMFSHDNGGKFVITLPEGLEVGTFKLKEINGDIDLSNITCESFHYGTTNGDSKLVGIHTKDVNISSINGDMQLEDFHATTVQLSQISGDMKIFKSTIEEEFNAHTVSGDISLQEVSSGDFRLKTVSGDIKGDEFYPKSVSLNSVSGDIKIKNSDADRPIVINHKKSISGDIEIKVK